MITIPQELEQWLDDVANLRPSHKIALLEGPNGSGKTYMARQLQGLVPEPTSFGAIHDISALRAALSTCNLVVLDNVSRLPDEWLETLFSSLEHGSISTRKLEVQLKAGILVTSIKLTVNRLDLQSRLLRVALS